MKKTIFTFLFCAIFALFFSLTNFALAEEPAVPQLRAPQNGATDSLTPVFRWYPAAGAERYNIYVDGRSREALRDLNYQFYEPFEPGDYYWGVRACNSDGCTDSETWVFTAKEASALAAPAAPTNLSPCNQTDVPNPPTLRWGNVGAKYYNVYIGKDSKSFLPPVMVMAPKTSVTINEDINYRYVLEDGESYLWYVEACNDTDKCSSSGYCWIVISSAPPSKVTPSPGEEITPTENGGRWITIKNPLGYATFKELLDAIVNNFFLVFAPAIAAVMFVIAGFMFVTSAGDPGKVRNAKNLALYTAIGLAIILLASGLIKVLQSIIGYQGP